MLARAYVVLQALGIALVVIGVAINWGIGWALVIGGTWLVVLGVLAEIEVSVEIERQMKGVPDARQAPNA